MRTLINYFRQCFCKHEFEKEEKEYEVGYWGGTVSDRTKANIYCNKCGYHKSFWKF